jgi:hypothetical protein
MTPLKNRVTELLDEQIDVLLDAHGITDEAARGKIKPVLVPMKNRADRVDFLALIPKPAAAAKPGAKPLTNREQARVPGIAKEQEGNNDAANAKKGALIRNRALEIEKRDKCTLSQAFLVAQSEIEQETK